MYGYSDNYYGGLFTGISYGMGENNNQLSSEPPVESSVQLNQNLATALAMAAAAASTNNGHSSPFCNSQGRRDDGVLDSNSRALMAAVASATSNYPSDPKLNNYQDIAPMTSYIRYSESQSGPPPSLNNSIHSRDGQNLSVSCYQNCYNTLSHSNTSSNFVDAPSNSYCNWPNEAGSLSGRSDLDSGNYIIGGSQQSSNQNFPQPGSMNPLQFFSVPSSQTVYNLQPSIVQQNSPLFPDYGGSSVPIFPTANGDSYISNNSTPVPIPELFDRFSGINLQDSAFGAQTPQYVHPICQGPAMSPHLPYENILQSNWNIVNNSNVTRNGEFGASPNNHLLHQNSNLNSPLQNFLADLPIQSSPGSMTWANIAAQLPIFASSTFSGNINRSANRSVVGHVIPQTISRDPTSNLAMSNSRFRNSPKVNDSQLHQPSWGNLNGHSSTKNRNSNYPNQDPSFFGSRAFPNGFFSRLGQESGAFIDGLKDRGELINFPNPESRKESEAHYQRIANQINPTSFNTNVTKGRFFVIKSFSEDDIHRSIKYSIWCSTEIGNKKLNAAFIELNGTAPIYLFFSVNGSGRFCGMAEMTSPIDYSTRAEVWAQDKWQGQFCVKWIFVKDIPNSALRHIHVETNENKPVTHSRDTTEVPLDRGRQVMEILAKYNHETSIFDDFLYYESRELQELNRKENSIRRH